MNIKEIKKKIGNDVSKVQLDVESIIKDPKACDIAQFTRNYFVLLGKIMIYEDITGYSKVLNNYRDRMKISGTVLLNFLGEDYSLELKEIYGLPE